VANIDRMKAGLSEAYAEGASALDAQPDARRETVDGVDVRVVESQVRLPSASSYVPSNDPSQYQLRAVGNLQPIKVIHRHYISVAEGREIKYEVVVVDAEGREEVLESSETVLVEVLTPWGVGHELQCADRFRGAPNRPSDGLDGRNACVVSRTLRSL
jgi:hypothetical protein